MLVLSKSLTPFIALISNGSTGLSGIERLLIALNGQALVPGKRNALPMASYTAKSHVGGYES